MVLYNSYDHSTMCITFSRKTDIEREDEWYECSVLTTQGHIFLFQCSSQGLIIKTFERKIARERDGKVL